jgi:hypothetical protein
VYKLYHVSLSIRSLPKWGIPRLSGQWFLHVVYITGIYSQFLPSRFYSYIFIIIIIVIIHGFLIYEHQLDAIFVINVFIWGGGEIYKSCQTSVDIIGLRVPTLKLRDALWFRFSLSFKNCPTASLATAVNSGSNDLEFFSEGKEPFYIAFSSISEGSIAKCLCAFVCLCLFVCFMCVLFILVCYPCLCVVLFVLWATWLLTQYGSNDN